VKLQAHSEQRNAAVRSNVNARGEQRRRGKRTESRASSAIDRENDAAVGNDDDNNDDDEAGRELGAPSGVVTRSVHACSPPPPRAIPKHSRSSMALGSQLFSRHCLRIWSRVSRVSRADSPLGANAIAPLTAARSRYSFIYLSSFVIDEVHERRHRALSASERASEPPLFVVPRTT